MTGTRQSCASHCGASKRGAAFFSSQRSSSRIAGISEARADRYMGHAQNTVGDRYRHRLRGQLADDAARLEEYLNGQAAEVVRLPTGAETGAQEPQAASLSGTG